MACALMRHVVCLRMDPCCCVDSSCCVTLIGLVGHSRPLLLCGFLLLCDTECVCVHTYIPSCCCVASSCCVTQHMHCVTQLCGLLLLCDTECVCIACMQQAVCTEQHACAPPLCRRAAPLILHFLFHLTIHCPLFCPLGTVARALACLEPHVTAERVELTPGGRIRLSSPQGFLFSNSVLVSLFE
jgi:hypothetical protein